MFSKQFEYKKKSFEYRIQKSKEELCKKPECIPIICENLSNNTTFKKINSKYLVSKESKLCDFNFYIRKQLGLNSSENIFLFVNKKIYLQNTLMKDIYDESKDEDGFLYINYDIENTFGY
jgi:GABA(A) receptor-associated protein